MAQAEPSGAGSTNVIINWPGSISAYAQGSITFSCWPKYRRHRQMLRGATTSALTLSYPLPNAPAGGDAFSVYQGCDHSAGERANRNSTIWRIFEGSPMFRHPAMQTEYESRAIIVAEARKWVGTPYHSCADVRGAGVDCGMLIVARPSSMPISSRLSILGLTLQIGIYNRGEERYLGFVSEPLLGSRRA